MSDMDDVEKVKIDRDLEIYGVAYTYDGKRLDPTKVLVYRPTQDGA